MIIDATEVNLTPSSVILTERLGIVVTLELITMKGKIYTLNVNQCFPRMATDYLAKPETLGELISYIIRRQHPAIQYIADRNGIRIVQFRERNSLSQAFDCIGYSSEP